MKIDDADVEFDDDELKEDDPNVTNIAQKAVVEKQTETLQNNPAYRAWLIRARGTVGALRVISKLSNFGSSSNEDSDFESDEEIEDQNDGQSVDLDKLKEYGWMLLSQG